MAPSFSSGGMGNLLQILFSSTPLGCQIYGAESSHLLGNFLGAQRAGTPIAPITDNNKVCKLYIPQQNDVLNVQINRITGDIKEIFKGQCICLASQEM